MEGGSNLQTTTTNSDDCNTDFDSHTSLQAMEFPRLPERPNDEPWSANVLAAFDILWQAHRESTEILQVNNVDPTRLSIHIDIIVKDVIPLLVGVESSMEEEGITQEWIEDASRCMLENYNKLKERVKNTKDS